PRAPPARLALDGPLHRAQPLGRRPDGGLLGRQGRAGRAIRFVAEARAKPRALLHQHRVPVTHQRLDTGRHERHAVFGRLDLSRHTDDHALSVIGYDAFSGPNDTTVCRSGAKNSAATAPTSSSVSSLTAAST